MLRSIIPFVWPYFAVSAACFAGTVAVQQYASQVLDLLSVLLVRHALLTWTFFVFAVASLDARILRAWRYVKFQDVGSKSAAQLLLGARQ